MEASEKKLNELRELEAADGIFGEKEIKEGLLNDEAASLAAGGIGGSPNPTASTSRPEPKNPFIGYDPR